MVGAGANIGIYSRFLLPLCWSDRRCSLIRTVAGGIPVACCVPSASSQTCVCLKLRWENAATSLTCTVSDKLNVDHRTYATRGVRVGVPIDIIALDDYFNSGQRVDLIKMDIQGYELHALRGGQRAYRKPRHQPFA